MKYTQLTQNDFAWCKMNTKQILAFPKKAADAIRQRQEDIKKIKKEDKTFLNTIGAYEVSNDDESRMLYEIHTLALTSDKKEIREAARVAEVEFSHLSVDLAYDEGMYAAIKEYHAGNYKKEKKSLDKQDIRLLDDMLLGFKRLGFDLAQKDREAVKKIDKKCSELENEYDARINEDNSYILCDESQIDGMPELVKNSLQIVDGKYKVSLQYPEYGPFMKYVHDRNKRKEMYKLFNNQGGTRNVSILKELVKLRAKKSKILGYKNHASYRTEVRMAKHEKHVYKMKNDLLKKLAPAVKRDFMTIAVEAEIAGYKDIQTHDTGYLVNRIYEKNYALDEQQMRQYFELGSVMDWMFTHFGDLFGFTVKKSEIKLWHRDANLFEIHDKKSKQIIAYLALDLYPREGKYGHACMMPIIEGGQIKKDLYRSPFAALICNFPKSTKNSPSLLTVREIETLFHEFGHGLHGLLTEAKHGSHAGTNVVWDFVEMPSQIMEQWVAEESILKKLGKHYKTGEAMPKELIQKIVKTKNLFQAIFYTRQCVQGLLDVDLYTGVATDPVKHYHELMSRYLINETKGIMFVSKFSHIVGGYDAGYYSYLWAERLAKDAYSIFKEGGLTNKTLGMKYRREILAHGGSRPEQDSIEAFLGRNISNNAFVESLL